MPLQEHIVPQEVTKYEFKIFAGLTWKQFIIVGGGAALAYLFYYLGNNQLLSSFIAYPLMILSFVGPVVATFVRIEGVPIILLVGRFLEYFTLPPLRVWRKNKMPKVLYKNRFASKPQVFPAYLGIYFSTNQIQQQARPSNQTTRTTVINIDSGYISKFANTEIAVPKVPNTLALQIIHKSNPLTSATVNILTRDLKPIYKGITNKYGIVYFKNPLPNGTYFIKVNHPDALFPTYTITLNGQVLPLIKISSLSNE